MRMMFVQGIIVMSLVASCSRTANDEEGPRARGFEAAPFANTPATARKRAENTRPRAHEETSAFERPRGREDYRAKALPIAETPRTVTENAPAPAAAPPPRDLSNELRALAGAPSSCAVGVDLSTAPAQIQISLDANVTTAGVVSRASVSAAGLPASVSECLRQRIGAARFTAPVPDAPRSVHATITLDRVAVPPPVPAGTPAAAPGAAPTAGTPSPAR